MLSEASLHKKLLEFMDLTTWKKTNIGYSKVLRGTSLTLHKRDGFLASHPTALRVSMPNPIRENFCAPVSDGQFLLYTNVKSGSAFEENYKFYQKSKNLGAMDWVYLNSFNLAGILQEIFYIAYAKDYRELDCRIHGVSPVAK